MLICIKHGLIGDCDTSNVEGIESMFSETSYFNQSIGDWDASNVEENEDMFKEAKSYNQSFGDKKILTKVNMNITSRLAVAYLNMYVVQ